jgi:copper chaperone CopZ
MFDSPIAYCALKGVWVALDQSAADCRAAHCCADSGCPLFSQGEVRLALRDVESPRDAASVRSALELIEGVREVRLSDDLQEAVVSFDPVKAEPAQFNRALRAVGYESAHVPAGEGCCGDRHDPKSE